MNNPCLLQTLSKLSGCSSNYALLLVNQTFKQKIKGSQFYSPSIEFNAKLLQYLYNFIYYFLKTLH